MKVIPAVLIAALFLALGLRLLKAGAKSGGSERWLAAFFLAPAMTSRPITRGGQMLFGIGAGATAMILTLYLQTDIPVYLAVLIFNTFTPTIDALWRPRVFGQRRFAWLGRKKSHRKKAS